MMSVEKLNYIKSLKHILMGLAEVVSTTEVTGIAIDSRKVEPGNLFLAYRGTNRNGLDYIDNAINEGAAAIVIDEAEIFNSESISKEIFVKLFSSLKCHLFSKWFKGPSRLVT